MWLFSTDTFPQPRVFRPISPETSHLYKKVYHKKLKRNSDDQRTQDCHKVSKRNLREGDLVFFHNGRKKRIASHVGIYLKDNKFIHASTSRGVINQQPE